MDIHGGRQRLDVKGADVSGSTFEDVNMSGCTMHDINLSGLRIDYTNLAGLHINNAICRGPASRTAGSRA